MKPLSQFFLCLALLGVGGTAPAEPGPPNRPPGAAAPPRGGAPAGAPRPAASSPVAVPIALEFDRIEIQRVAQTLSERTHRSVLLDGSVQPALPVTATGTAKTLEEALDQLTRPLGLAWKKVYVAKGPAPVNGERIASLVESIKGVPAAGVVVEDPAARQVTLYLRNLPAAADLEAQIRTAWPFLEPVYLLSDPRPAAKKPDEKERARPAPPDRFANLERERMELLLKMSPEERAKATQRAMNMLLQIDPDAMQEMMRSGMQAWVQTMQQMTPEQRQQWMQMSLRMFQSIPPETWQNMFQMFRPGPGSAPPPGR